jgi:hypothetical protein
MSIIRGNGAITFPPLKRERRIVLSGLSAVALAKAEAKKDAGRDHFVRQAQTSNPPW